MKRWWILGVGLALAMTATALVLLFDDQEPLTQADLREHAENHQRLIAGPTSTSTAPTPICDTIQRREQTESTSTGRRGPFHDGVSFDWLVVTSIEEGPPHPADDRFPKYEIEGTIRDGRSVSIPGLHIDEVAGPAIARALADEHRVALLIHEISPSQRLPEPSVTYAVLVSPTPEHSFFLGRCAKSDLEEPVREQLGERFDQVTWALPTTPVGDATYELIYGEPRPEPTIPPPPTTNPTYEFSRMTFVVTSDTDLPDAHACFRSPELGWGEQVKCIEPMQDPIRYLATVSDTRTMVLWLSQDHTVPRPVELVGRLEIPEDIFESAERPAVRIHLMDVDKPGQTTFEILAWGDAATLDFGGDPLWQSPFETLKPG